MQHCSIYTLDKPPVEQVWLESLIPTMSFAIPSCLDLNRRSPFLEMSVTQSPQWYLIVLSDLVAIAGVHEQVGQAARRRA